jgi:RNA-binding protein
MENWSMQKVTNAQRAYLRRTAQQLKPLVQIGKQGLNEGVRTSLERALETHELVKVKFLDVQDRDAALIDELAESSGSALIHKIGGIFVLYRQQPDPEKRKIEIP